MAPWTPLTSEVELQALIDNSHSKDCVLLKHSTTCPISSIAKLRIDDDWDLDSDKVQLYYLDLLSYRSISNKIAEKFETVHESPQILIIKNGRSVYDVSHLDINMKEIKDGLLEV